MTLFNPNRFVTGLSDISYVKQVNLQETQIMPGQVEVPGHANNPIRVQESVKVRDRFVRDTFTPETIPDNAPDDEIG
jgi:hypothetical protein